MRNKTVSNTRYVTIEHIDPVGNYGLPFRVSDGHHPRIYSWSYLYRLCRDEQSNWRRYLAQLRKTQGSRDPEAQVLKVIDATKPR